MMLNGQNLEAVMAVDRRKLTEIQRKILAGLDLSAQKLIEAKKRNDQYLIIFRDGKIQKIKARDL
jgi:hypothetical protein